MSFFKSAIAAICYGILGTSTRVSLDSGEADAPVPQDQEFPVLPATYRATLFRWWVLLIVAQWCIVLPAALGKSLFLSLPGDYPATARVVPLAHDFFFIVWNLLPLALAFCTWLVEAGVSRVALTTHGSVRDQAKASVAQAASWLRRRTIIIPLVTIGLAVAVLGTVQQFVKVARWHETMECAYWWDFAFSPLIFYVRLIALAANLFCIVVDIAVLLVLLIAFARLAHARLWKLDLLHVDGCGGVGQYGRTALAFTTIPFLAATCGLLGYFDHRAAGPIQSLGDTVMLVLATAFGALTFALPLRPIHREMLRAKAAACASLRTAIDSLANMLPPDAEVRHDSEYLIQLRSIKEDRELLVDVYRMYAKAPTWPLNLAIGARIAGTIAGPLAVFLVDQIKTHVIG